MSTAESSETVGEKMGRFALEKAFRSSYNDFVRQLGKSKLVSSDLYVVKLTGFIPKVFLRSFMSFFIYIFYPNISFICSDY